MSRLKKYNEETKALTFRIPLGAEPVIKQAVAKLLKDYIPTKTNNQATGNSPDQQAIKKPGLSKKLNKTPIKAAEVAISPATVQPEPVKATDKPLKPSALTEFEQKRDEIMNNKRFAPLQKQTALRKLKEAYGFTS